MKTKEQCPKCKRIVGVEDGVFAKHRTGHSPSHCKAIKHGKYAGSHRTITPSETRTATIKPVCEQSGKKFRKPTVKVDKPTKSAKKKAKATAIA